MSDNNELRLMFLASQDFEKGEAVRGGMLVTDDQTKPLEFRCTSPIRPTRLQKVLYGKLLHPHMLIELIATPLVRSASEQPHIILVRDKEILKLQDKVNIPVVWLGLNEEDIGSDEEKTDDSPLITSETGKFEPIVVRGVPGKVEETRRAKQLLTQVFAGHNLLEPFERIKNALEQVHNEQAGNKQ